MAIKFCEIQPFVTSVIIGATNTDQLKKNLQSHEIKLDDETITAINEIQLNIQIHVLKKIIYTFCILIFVCSHAESQIKIEKI